MNATFLDVLLEIIPPLHSADILWVLTGSLAFALQGMPLEIHDIDIQTDKDGAYKIAGIFPESVIKPVSFSSTDLIRSHFGRLLMDDVKVEIMGDVQTRLPDGNWRPPPDLNHLKRYIEVNGFQIPILPLQHEYQAYVAMGRHERAKSLHDWLDTRHQGLNINCKDKD
jgi:hypothetical protein